MKEVSDTRRSVILGLLGGVAAAAVAGVLWASPASAAVEQPSASASASAWGTGTDSMKFGTDSMKFG